jgi:hypothetical protein
MNRVKPRQNFYVEEPEIELGAGCGRNGATFSGFGGTQVSTPENVMSGVFVARTAKPVIRLGNALASDACAAEWAEVRIENVRRIGNAQPPRLMRRLITPGIARYASSIRSLAVTCRFFDTFNERIECLAKHEAFVFATA